MGKDLSKAAYCIFFCNGGSCLKNGAEKITKEVRAHLRMEGLYHTTHTIKTMCMGRCADGPNIQVMPDGIWYKEMTVEKGIDIVEKHIKGNTVIKEYILFKPGMDDVQSRHKLLPGSKKEFHTVRDSELRTMLLANADAWEMNLYPLLKAIFTKFYASAEVYLPDNPYKSHRLEYQAGIQYQDQAIKINASGFDLELVIGIPGKNEPGDVQNERISFIDVFKQMIAPFKCGIRFRNKIGKTKLTVIDMSPHLILWEHVAKIYLDKGDEEIKIIKQSHMEFLNIV